MDISQKSNTIFNKEIKEGNKSMTQQLETIRIDQTSS